MKLSSLNKKVLSGLAIVTLTLSSSVAFAGNNQGDDNNDQGKKLYNPNTPSLTVVNSISDVHGYVGAFGAENIIYYSR